MMDRYSLTLDQLAHPRPFGNAVRVTDFLRREAELQTEITRLKHELFLLERSKAALLDQARIIKMPTRREPFGRL